MIPRSVTAARCTGAAAAALGAVLLAACGSAGSPSGASSASSPASTPATSGASSTPASAAPGTSAAAAACATSALRIAVDTTGGGAAAGSTYYPIDFTNTGSAACTLFGYPGVSFVTGSTGGSEIGQPASRNSGAAATVVTLAPGGAAHAILQVVDAGNYSASACHPVTAHWLRVYPPGQTAPGYAAFTTQVCSAKLPANLGSPLSVYPVRPGKGQPGQAP